MSMAEPNGRLRCFDDRQRIDAEMGIQISDRACLAEMFDAEAGQHMTMNRTEPSERCRMTVRDRYHMRMLG